MKNLSLLLLAWLGTVIGAAGQGKPAAKTGGPIVLVHGAWMDDHAWYRVAPLLKAAGRDVILVNLPGHGTDVTPYAQIQLQTYVDAVKKAIGTRKNVTLVGHSMAGIVISQVAEQIPGQIGQLVYVAAYLPRNGETLYQLSQQDSASQVGKYWRQDDPAHYSPASIAQEGIVPCFAADAPEADKTYLVQHHKADALGPMATPVQLTDAAFGKLPKRYICTTQDQAVSYALQQKMLAATPVGRVDRLETSHSPFFSQPEVLAKLLLL
ncbi:alpha/beta hydrolase [Nostoc sp. NIES-2111]